ncbi:MAG TPA: PKD domain-containing protein, partial [Candidatus Dormibacteraeota bacterium]
MAASFWLAAAPLAHATDTLDQSQTATGFSVTVDSTQMLAQTFTAGMTGQLDLLSLFVGESSGGGAIQIQSVAAGGQPSGTSLGATTYSGFLPAQWRDYPLGAAVSITAGTQYAIVVIPNSGSTNTVWLSSRTDVYAGGQAWSGTQATGTWTLAPHSPTGAAVDFEFKTWVATGVNQAPVVAAASSAVSVNEGAVPSNSGTYSDADGDNVSLTASAGTLTKTGTSSGTWSWTQAAADEGPSQSVTITADDGNGSTATTLFTLTIVGVAPTAQIAGAPATALEGATVSLTGSATSPSAGDTFTYSWTVTKNGGAYASGTGASFSFQPDDEGAYAVSLQATDDGGFSGTASATVNGTNVAPTATITSVSPSAAPVLVSQEQVTFAGHFSDPGVGDSHTVTWTFGDGATSTTSFAAGGGADFSVSHAYAKAGTYSVGLAVVDDDGGLGKASTTVVVGTPAQAIASLVGFVQDLPDLKQFQRNSLLRKLDSLGRSLQRGQTEAACDQLDTLLHRFGGSKDERYLSAQDLATLTAIIRA